MAKKKRYERPQVKQIKLVTETAVLAGCKMASDDPDGKSGSGCYIAKCRYETGT